VGWLTLIGGQIVGLGLASAYDCEESLVDDCSDQGIAQFLLYLSVAAPTVISATLAWAVSYGLQLLDRIEWNSRQSIYLANRPE